MDKDLARFDMRVPADFLVEVDRWRAQFQPIKSRVQAFMELTRLGLASEKQRKRSKP
jgi:hypothetical protein